MRRSHLSTAVLKNGRTVARIVGPAVHRHHGTIGPHEPGGGGRHRKTVVADHLAVTIWRRSISHRRGSRLLLRWETVGWISIWLLLTVEIAVDGDLGHLAGGAWDGGEGRGRVHVDGPVAGARRLRGHHAQTWTNTTGKVRKLADYQ